MTHIIEAEVVDSRPAMGRLTPAATDRPYLTVHEVSARWVTRRRLAGLVVVVAAASGGVSHPSHQRQYQADDEEDHPEDQNNVGEGEGRDEAREEESSGR